MTSFEPLLGPMARARGEAQRLFEKTNNPAVKANATKRVFALMIERMAQSLVLEPRWHEQRRYLSVDHWLLEHGAFFTWRSNPDESFEASIMECYRNARVLGLEERNLPYVEGVFCSGVSIAPADHAWNLDRNGNVVDYTIGGFMGPDRTYFGAVFAGLYVRSVRGSVLNDIAHGEPLLQDDELLNAARGVRT